MPDEAADYFRAIDREIIALAEGYNVDDPLLVITGDDAEIYVQHGRLPVQHVPDPAHRGLIELLSSRHEP